MLFPGILCDKMYHEKNIQEVRNTHSSGSQEEGWNWELLKKNNAFPPQVSCSSSSIILCVVLGQG